MVHLTPNPFSLGGYVTITEALAEIKTIGKRIEGKRASVTQYLYRQERLKDPLAKDGGSQAFIVAERQAIRDLQARVVSLRRAIASANASTTVIANGTPRTVAEWLTWRREVAPGESAFLQATFKAIGDVRKKAIGLGLQVSVKPTEQSVDDVLVNVDEGELAREADALANTLGTLDGLLSLTNATTQVVM